MARAASEKWLIIQRCTKKNSVTVTISIVTNSTPIIGNNTPFHSFLQAHTKTYAFDIISLKYMCNIPQNEYSMIFSTTLSIKDFWYNKQCCNETPYHLVSLTNISIYIFFRDGCFSFFRTSPQNGRGMCQSKQNQPLNYHPDKKQKIIRISDVLVSILSQT